MLSSIGENVTGKSNVKYRNAKRPWLIFTMSAFKKITINFMIGAAIQRRFEWMHFSDTHTNKLPLISAVCLPLSMYMAQPASHIYCILWATRPQITIENADHRLWQAKEEENLSARLKYSCGSFLKSPILLSLFRAVFWLNAEHS